MLSWLAPIIVFGLVIFVHELGHFMPPSSGRLRAAVLVGFAHRSQETNR